jgi:NAD(P)-dependent dehydrogenase (short-subunit alcohol dehydrogenase family)
VEQSKVILVTGASRGIGAGLVKNFAKKNFRVVINYSKSDEEAVQLYREIASGVGRNSLMLMKADVSKRTAVKDMFNTIIANYGRVDVLINNAGINFDGPFLEMTDEQWQRVIDTNLTGTFICAQEFALHFTGEVGHIINIGASTGFRGRKNGCNYCSSKAGVINLTKCLALELAPRIRVNCIIPGFIETAEVMKRCDLYRKENYDAAVSSIPMARMGTADDVFNMADFIIENSTYITGQNLFVNGGDFMY